MAHAMAAPMTISTRLLPCMALLPLCPVGRFM
jgi:hypothetical protein